MERRSPLASIWVLAALVATFAAAGCGEDNGTPTAVPATNTATRTATPTATVKPSPTTASETGSVSGLLVLGHDVSAGSSDALGTPPPQFAESADAKAFDRSLAAANWAIDGGMQGVTGPDGRFTAGALPAGSHTLQISKTLDGNLASASIPFTVGDDGGADLVVEVSWGQVKSISTYTQGGAELREVRAPSGSWVILRDGRTGSFGDWGRTFVDANGDGTFEVTPCLDSTGNMPPASGEPCKEDQACNPGERCLCVPSCPECDDCAKSVCVPSCPPVQLTAVSVSGPSQIVVGQQGPLSATAQLSDGSTFDVTYLVDWISSDSDVATVDSWGTVTAVQIGSTSITAALGALSSDPWPLQVTARPALRKIDLQNVSCVYPMGAPTAGGALPVDAAPPERSDILPVPNCTQVVEIGGTIQFRAIGEFDNNYFQDITDEVQWQVTPPEVGSVTVGLFTGLQAGTAQLTAALEGVTSDATEIRVVTQPTVIGLTIYAENSGFPIVATAGQTPVAVASGMPCLLAEPADASGVPCCCPGPMINSDAPCRCIYSITVLVGDQLKFHATAQYDTGAWKDVTSEVTWKSGDSSVASIDVGGVMSALQAGDTAITATLDTVTSDPANVHVVDHATLQSLWIYQEGQDGVVAKGDQRFFHAMGSYDIGISREVTTDAAWQSSDPSVGGFDIPGVFTGRAAGDVQVWTELGGVQSNQLPLEVFETSELSYCDPNNVNRAVWSDDFNRVILESDCSWYNQPGLATLRYTVTEMQPHGGIFNPCLDLYVFAGPAKVRTIREEGCGDPFLAANAPGRDQEAVKYQLRAFWDLKDENGNAVPPGTYTIYGRFYLYYDPVVSLKVQVLAPNEPTPTPQPTNAISPTATPQPTPVGAGCLVGGSAASACDGSVKPMSRDLCCTLAQEGALPAAVSWCNDFDASAGKCVSCTDACMEQTTPTPAPCCEPGLGIACPVDLVCPTPTPAPTAVCTPPTCPAGAALFCGTPTGTPGGLGCCPVGWDLYPCSFVNGERGLACHNPAMGCPSSEVCGDGCDSVVTGTCDGCSDGCGYVCVSGTPTPTPSVPEVTPITPAPVCTPPKCDIGEVLQCPGYCPGGCGYVCGPTLAAWLRVVSATGQPGEAVTFAVSFTAAGQRVARVENYLRFSPYIGIGAKADGTPDCAVNPDIHKNATAFSFVTIGDETWMHARVYDNSNSDSIPDGAVLYTCVVNIAPTAAPATYPLIIWSATGTTPEGATLAILGQEGAIVVTGTPQPTCTPPPCGPGEVFHCPGPCLGDCGMSCATPTATPPPTATLAPISLVAGSASGHPGDLVSFAVSMSAGGQRVWGVGNDVSFDPLTAIAATADGEPDCSVNPQTHKTGLFNFQPVGCSPGECNGVRALVLSILSLAPIPGDMVLYTCNVRISDDAPAGSYPLRISRTDASTTDSRELPVIDTDGEIVVSQSE